MADKNKISFSFKNALILALAVVLIIFVGWLSANTHEKNATHALRAHLIEKSNLFQKYLSGELNKIELMADMLAHHPNIQTGIGADASYEDQTSANEFLKETNDKLNTATIYVMDKTGLTVSASNYLEPQSFMHKNYAFRPYFIDALNTGKGSFLAIGVTSDKLGYYISRAIYRDESLIGVLVIKYDLHLLHTLSRDFKGDFVLVDDKNIIFYSSQTDLQLKSIGTISAKDRLFIVRTKQYPITRIQPLTIKGNTDALLDASTVQIGSNEYLFSQIELQQPKWSIMVLGSLQGIKENAFTNGAFISCVSVIILLSFYLIYRRRIDNERLQTIVENLPSGVTLFNDKLQMLICNERFKEILKFPDDLFTNRLPNLRDLIKYNARRGEYGEGDPDQLIEETLAKTKLRKDHVFERVRPDGTILEIRGKWLKDAFVTTYTDITERKKAEEDAKRNASYLQALLQNLDQGVTVIDENLNIIFWNKAFFTLLELPETLIDNGMTYENILRFNAERGEYGDGDVEQQIKSRMQAALRFEPHHFERMRPDGRTLEVTGKPLNIDGKTFGFITTYVDITEHKRMAERLRKMANTDVLTELYNRRYFTLLLSREIKRCQRAGHSLSVLLLDLDHFKAVNDTHGHNIGDLTLKKFAQTCRGLLRNIDIMGRLGGEEFCIFLPETDRAGAFILAERLRSAIENMEVQNEEGETFFITVSIGVALYDEMLEDRMEDIIRRADKALYHAKSQGRNKVC